MNSFKTQLLLTPIFNLAAVEFLKADTDLARAIPTPPPRPAQVQAKRLAYQATRYTPHQGAREMRRRQEKMK